jgi:dTDP-4-dehydrorhamnose reductase
MLGRAVVEELENKRPYVATGSEVDLRDEKALRSVLEQHRPQKIINCAAYTNVDKAETEEDLAREINATGVGRLGFLAAEFGAEVMHISTDYVFPGDGHTPYREDEPTGPLNAYGRTKLEGERLLAWSGAKHWIVRTSWLFGRHRPNFVSTMMHKMTNLEPVKVVTDQRGRPTYADDLAKACLTLMGFSMRPAAPYGVYHFANGGDVSWFEFTKEIAEMVRSSGKTDLPELIAPILSVDLARPAKRPSWSVLDTSKIEEATGRKPRSHQEATSEYLSRMLGDP